MKRHFLLGIALAAVITAGAGCKKNDAEYKAPEQKPPVVQQQKNDQPPAEPETSGTWVHPTYGFSFSLPLKTSSKFESADSIDFVDAATQQVYGEMAIAEGIPGIPLSANLIEEISVGGVKGTLYHDTDAQIGTTKIDKLMVIMPSNGKTVYIAVPVQYMDQMNIKEMAKTWKWGNE